MENGYEMLRVCRDCSVNLDPDGFASFALLHCYLNSELVGFNNAKDKIWFVSDKPIDYTKFLYVDYDVNQPLFSIGHHIIGLNDEHNTTLNNGYHLNPNVLYHISRDNFTSKYPFNTFMLIAALLERNGYDINIDLYKQSFGGLQVGMYILAIDGVILNLKDYALNCTNWWNVLLTLSNNGKFTTALYNYSRQIDLTYAFGYRSMVTTNLYDMFKVEKKDGGYDYLTKDNANHIYNLINFYIDIISGREDLHVYRPNAFYEYVSEFCKNASIESLTEVIFHMQ